MPFSANSPAGSTVTCSTASPDGLQCCKLANCFFRFAAGLQKGYFDTLDDLKDAKALFDE